MSSSSDTDGSSSDATNSDTEQPDNNEQAAAAPDSPVAQQQNNSSDNDDSETNEATGDAEPSTSSVPVDPDQGGGEETRDGEASGAEPTAADSPASNNNDVSNDASSPAKSPPAAPEKSPTVDETEPAPAATASNSNTNDLYDERDSSPPAKSPDIGVNRSDGDDDDEEGGSSKQRPTAADIFGEGVSSSDEDSDDDVNDKPAEKKKRGIDSDSDGSLKIDRDRARSGERSDEERAGSQMGMLSDAEPEEPPIPEVTIDVSAPQISINLSQDGTIPYFVKLPNFLSVDAKPFDPTHYEEENEEEDIIDEEGRNRLKLKCENTIRWRVIRDEDGNEIRQSNTKVVRWSDGSLSLHLGTEVFDVQMQRMQDHNHLFIRQGAGLQAESIFKQKMTFRPSSTDTMTHRKMTLGMADRTTKTTQAKLLALADHEHDPDKAKRDIVRREEDRIRAASRREAQQRRIRERGATGGLSANYLENYDSDDQGDSIAALKRSYKAGGSNYDRIAHDKYSDSDSDEAPEKDKGGRRVVSDSDDEERSSHGEEAESSKKKNVIESDDDDVSD